MDFGPTQTFFLRPVGDCNFAARSLAFACHRIFGVASLPFSIAATDQALSFSPRYWSI